MYDNIKNKCNSIRDNNLHEQFPT